VLRDTGDSRSQPSTPNWRNQLTGARREIMRKVAGAAHMVLVSVDLTLVCYSIFGIVLGLLSGTLPVASLVHLVMAKPLTCIRSVLVILAGSMAIAKIVSWIRSLLKHGRRG
jgi:choline-glycine betaine transporter